MNIDLTKFYSALSNETRLRCLYLVSKFDEICVCDVVETLDITQPAASKALHILRDIGLLKDRKDANWNYYRISPDIAEWTKSILDTTVTEMDHSSCYDRDRKRIQRLISCPQSDTCT